MRLVSTNYFNSEIFPIYGIQCTVYHAMDLSLLLAVDVPFASVHLLPISTWILFTTSAMSLDHLVSHYTLPCYLPRVDEFCNIL